MVYYDFCALSSKTKLTIFKFVWNFGKMPRLKAENKPVLYELPGS